MTWTQHILLRGRHIATIARGPLYIEREWRKPVGFALFCPTCSDLWLNCPIPNAPSRVLASGCSPPHALGPLDWSGVIDQWGLDLPFLEALPRNVLIHNTLAHIAHYEHYHR